ncbi:Phosphoadenosine phosphosulfate reductase [bioreactor metagenome]|uniref:Phosphoadenosine phosphosulfate reductase n=1 Tax=bioreactor metagenome TaxID=1076179 RepID=A0A644W3J6_9ZZZZ
MWCKKCNRETESKKCEICGAITEEEVPYEVWYCPHCHIPLIVASNDIVKNVCPRCSGETHYLCVDIRPVFPEERLLIELLMGKPLAYKEKSVWASNNRYYIDGIVKAIPNLLYQRVDMQTVNAGLREYASQNDYAFFESNIAAFCQANQRRLQYLFDEASSFIQDAASKYPAENIVISFSGGKDSTVTADLVVRALSNPSIVHIFGNTTLEFPSTIEYATRFRKENPKAIFKTAQNSEQDFYKMCEEIGPPARMMRWCCSMFKTGPISRVLNSLYRDTQILTFYGIRKCESVARSKYNRIEANAESVKIQKQTVASPIFFWKDIDIWLYILSEHIDFNDAYRLGYDRVGCWCCPNNNVRAQYLSAIYMPEQSDKWRSFLVEFARKIGKPDAEVYVDTGKWKARQGGNGLPAAEDIKIKFTNCTAEEHAKIYQLNKQMASWFSELFNPFGRVAPELGRKLINEIIIVDIRTQVPIISIQPFTQEGYTYAVKIQTMNVAKHDDLQRMISYQIRKYNACRKCLKCESICRFGAISIIADEYHINASKCHRCKMCVTAKYLDGGCMMDKYLKTKG